MAKCIRAKSVCIFRCGSKILLAEGCHSNEKGRYLIPIGGQIKYGETSKEAAIRETYEEIGARIVQLRLLTVIENIFQYEGLTNHELVFVYDGEFESEESIGQKEIMGVEDDGAKFKARWIEKDLLIHSHTPIYPRGISEFL